MINGPPNPQNDADREYLTTLFPLFKNFPADFEFPLVADPNYKPRSNTLFVLISGTFACAITLVVASLRFWIRSRGSFGMDDWVMGLAFIFYCVFNCVNLVGMSSTGLGYHLYDLSLKDIHSSLVIQYLHTLFWTLALHLTRCSILHLFLRVAPTQSFLQRRFLQTVLFASYAFLITNMGILIFECKPVQASFDLRARLDGRCPGSNSIGIYAGLCAGHIALDVLTIFPPIPVIAKLPMDKRKKMNLYILLTLGVITIILTSVRMFVFYKKMVESFDLTRNAIAIGFWGILESSLAVTIACLPALNRSILRCGRRWRGDETDRRPKTYRGKHGIIRFDAHAPVYKGHTKYVSYSAGATAEGTLLSTSSVELDERDQRRRSQLTMGNGDTHRSSHSLSRSVHMPGDTPFTYGSDAYPDITVQKSFHVIEETASVIEGREGLRIPPPTAKPPKPCLFSSARWNQPSSPNPNGTGDDDSTLISKK